MPQTSAVNSVIGGGVRDEREIGLQIDVRAAQTGQAVGAHHRREPDDEQQRAAVPIDASRRPSVSRL